MTSSIVDQIVEGEERSMGCPLTLVHAHSFNDEIWTIVVDVEPREIIGGLGTQRERRVVLVTPSGKTSVIAASSIERHI